MGLLEIIDRTWVGDFIRRKADIILDTDPDNIYVENIRSFFGTTTRLARFMCDFAVRCGHFTKHVGFICPNDTCKKIITDFPIEQVMYEDNLECLNCLLRDEVEYGWNTSKLEKIEFYRLNRRVDASS